MNTNEHLPPIDYNKVREAENIVSTLQNPRRRRIIDFLETFGPMSILDISAQINMDKQSVENHLNALRRIHVVESERRDGNIFFYLNTEKLVQINNALNRFFE